MKTEKAFEIIMSEVFNRIRLSASLMERKELWDLVENIKSIERDFGFSEKEIHAITDKALDYRNDS